MELLLIYVYIYFLISPPLQFSNTEILFRAVDFKVLSFNTLGKFIMKLQF